MFMTGVLCTVCGAQVYFKENVHYFLKLNYQSIRKMAQSVRVTQEACHYDLDLWVPKYIDVFIFNTCMKNEVFMLKHLWVIYKCYKLGD